MAIIARFTELIVVFIQPCKWSEGTYHRRRRQRRLGTMTLLEDETILKKKPVAPAA